MLQQTCARKFCRGQVRGDDRIHDQPAIPRREHKDFLRPKDISRFKHGAVTACLCDFLVERGVTPVQVLKTAGLPHATGATLMPFKLYTRPLSPSCLTQLFLMQTLPALITLVILRRHLSLMLVLESSFLPL